MTINYTIFYVKILKITFMKVLNLFYCICAIFYYSNLSGQVVYQDLNAQHSDDGVVINWTTLEEENLKTFTLEKSVNGVQYFPIFESASRKETGEITNYSFLDTKINNAIVYYRIKEQLLNDAYSYSLVVEISQKNDNNLLIDQVSDISNISKKGIVSIYYTSLIPGKLTYSINNNTNTILSKEEKYIFKGANLLSVDFSLFPKGRYTIKMQMNEEIELISFEKLENHFNFEANNNLPRSYTVKNRLK